MKGCGSLRGEQGREGAPRRCSLAEASTNTLSDPSVGSKARWADDDMSFKGKQENT